MPVMPVINRAVIIVLALLSVAEPTQAVNSSFSVKSDNTQARDIANREFSHEIKAIQSKCFGEVSAQAAINYPLHSGDTLRISVWHETDLAQEVLVRPDGGITFPLVGDVDVAGLTLNATEEKIKQRLEKYITDAQVHVSLQSAAGNIAYVIGKVNRPGPVPLAGRVTVVQALSVAGGATVYAEVDEIRVLRQCEGKQQAFTVNYADIERGINLEQNIALQSGDVLVVP
jgi:polysaccharide biosynthesis/export protein